MTLVAIDGMDGTGKTTIVDKLAEEGFFPFKYPHYEGSSGKKILDYLQGDMSTVTYEDVVRAMRLMVENRLETNHVLKGKDAVVDRYILSNYLANYPILVDLVGEEQAWETCRTIIMEEYAREETMIPDVYIVLYAEPSVIRERITQRMEEEGIAIQDIESSNYLRRTYDHLTTHDMSELMRHNHGDVHVIDTTNQTMEEVFEHITRILK